MRLGISLTGWSAMTCIYNGFLVISNCILSTSWRMNALRNPYGTEHTVTRTASTCMSTFYMPLNLARHLLTILNHLVVSTKCYLNHLRVKESSKRELSNRVISTMPVNGLVSSDALTSTGRVMLKFVSLIITPLRAKFFRGNKNMYLHFRSLFHTDMTQVVEILPQVRPILHSQYHGCWCPGDARSQGISNHEILAMLNRMNSTPAR